MTKSFDELYTALAHFMNTPGKRWIGMECVRAAFKRYPEQKPALLWAADNGYPELHIVKKYGPQ
jgi:hypothetical protein